jgi:hypothetical protein
LLNTVLATFSEGTPPIPPSSYESIASVVTTAGQTSITFTSIPATYKSLQIRILARRSNGTTGTDTEYLRFNSDSGSNYAFHYLYGNGATASVSSSASTSLIACYEIGRNGTTANSFGVSIIDIIDYASTTKNKTVRAFFGLDLNGSGSVTLGSGLWMNTNAITDININAAADPMAAGSTFALY